MKSRADKAHAIAYEHEQLAEGRSRCRVADPNSGQFLFNSAANFASWNSKYFKKIIGFIMASSVCSR